jgi:hypothetical protein
MSIEQIQARAEMQMKISSILILLTMCLSIFNLVYVNMHRNKPHFAPKEKAQKEEPVLLGDTHMIEYVRTVNDDYWEITDTTTWEVFRYSMDGKHIETK